MSMLGSFIFNHIQYLHIYVYIYTYYTSRTKALLLDALSITPRILQDVKPAGVGCSYFLLVKPPKIYFDSNQREIRPHKMDFNM